MNIFAYNTYNNTLEINEYEILLIKEFKVLHDRDLSDDKEKFFRELTYMYLMIDWKSPYAEFADPDRKEESINDSGLSEEDLVDPDFLNACEKYYTIQQSDLKVLSVLSARRVVHKLIDYYQNEVDFTERNANTNAVIFKASEITKEVGNLGELLDKLSTLEKNLKKETQQSNNIRGGAVDGFILKT